MLLKYCVPIRSYKERKEERSLTTTELKKEEKKSQTNNELDKSVIKNVSSFKEKHGLETTPDFINKIKTFIQNIQQVGSLIFG